MLYSIENNSVRIEVDSFGAELKAVTGLKKQTEFLWNSDPKYWHSSAPVLFPIIGELWNNKTTINGKEYSMKRHGILRYKEFKLVHKTENQLFFEAAYDEDTLKNYPFKFIFQMIYTILEVGVKVACKVKNVDEVPFKFHVGTHPAFMCPITKGEDFEDCILTFNREESCEAAQLDGNGYYPREKKPFLNNTKVLNLSRDISSEGALILEHLNSNRVTLSSKKSSSSLTIDFTGFTHIALWQSKPGAPFLCIEPWYGHSDYAYFKGSFEEKDELQTVNPKEEFNCSYSITFVE